MKRKPALNQSLVSLYYDIMKKIKLVFLSRFLLRTIIGYTHNKTGKRSFISTKDKILNMVLSFAYFCCCMLIAWLLFQVTTFASFKIPTNSMEPALMPGDNIMVNKWIMGGRIFNVFDAVNGKVVTISRLPHFGKVKRNDVLVFNFPYKRGWDSIGIDIMKYYVKRCVALPGDTFEIKRAHYSVRGHNSALGNAHEQEALRKILESGREKDYGIVLNGYPYNGLVPWSVLNFGPLYIPAKGTCTQMSIPYAVLYRNVIEWEQKKKLHIQGQHVLLGDSVIYRYRFKENYYFVTGDKVMNSQDSRYWGLLPEPFIVGKAVRIWKSVDKETGKIRWDRVFKRIE